MFGANSAFGQMRQPVDNGGQDALSTFLPSSALVFRQPLTSLWKRLQRPRALRKTRAPNFEI
ncbi:hypothetical protein AJ88_06995 [Mesorhizobium amorphae CCBAU 01583]|nr:hypothetical protein AJ88_06995 [Mesorhizobium amorphae CCBAU 01583]